MTMDDSVPHLLKYANKKSARCVMAVSNCTFLLVGLPGENSMCSHAFRFTAFFCAISTCLAMHAEQRLLQRVEVAALHAGMISIEVAACLVGLLWEWDMIELSVLAMCADMFNGIYMAVNGFGKSSTAVHLGVLTLSFCLPFHFQDTLQGNTLIAKTLNITGDQTLELGPYESGHVTVGLTMSSVVAVLLVQVATTYLQAALAVVPVEEFADILPPPPASSTRIEPETMGQNSAS
eukprot:TRINITY_DN11841_c0_g3_i2.p1 TRINITY_DN11841_c0_g3~~TRINITY_DN11841_c0_g3_i2.p1  ORF type:complete len:235 (+),score=32.87 TRINITY_DN11841_c0_g3_i2:64-768(+)